MTKLNGLLPEGEANGLEAISQSLINDPEQRHVIIALIDCKSLTTNIDTGDIVPTARILAIEAMDTVSERDARRLMANRRDRRTGKTTLVGINTETGEVDS